MSLRSTLRAAGLFGLWLLLFSLYPSAFILSQSPVLRIETGMHTAAIKRIATDAQNRFLVTASEDKTARVWELPAGRLLRVLRPPLGEGNEGKLFSVALSPDGNTVATAGWTGYEWDNSFSIYLFDRASGALRQRLSGLPGVVSHLTYSPDGRWLAAMLGGSGGVRLFDAQHSYTFRGQDTAYGNDSYGADFDITGRLATISLDGNLRLYSTDSFRGLQLLAMRAVPGGKLPISVSITPDGTRLAVGFYDSPQVRVFSGFDLSSLKDPDVRGVTSPNSGCVEWSADGRILYAG